MVVPRHLAILAAGGLKIESHEERSWRPPLFEDRPENRQPLDMNLVRSDWRENPGKRLRLIL